MTANFPAISAHHLHPLVIPDEVNKRYLLNEAGITTANLETLQLWHTKDPKGIAKPDTISE